MPPDDVLLSEEVVRKVARLSKLAPSDEQISLYRRQLSDVLSLMSALRSLDLSGVEPLAHVGEARNRLRDDEPGPTLPRDQVLSLAPDRSSPFIKVPKVLGEGGGA